MSDQPTQPTTKWIAETQRRLGLLLCHIGRHNWHFHHDAKPPVVTCARCGRTDPMPYGDQRLPYL